MEWFDVIKSWKNIHSTLLFGEQGKNNKEEDLEKYQINRKYGK